MDDRPVEQVDFDLWPTGPVEARVTSRSPPPAVPGEIALAFHPAPTSAGKLPDAPAGRIVCPVRRDVMSCDLPAGTMDLRLAASGFTPHYLWRAVIASRMRNQLGAFALVPGASLSGYISGGVGDHPGVRVQLLNPTGDLIRPKQPTPGTWPGRDDDTTYVSAAVNDRGFFQFAGMAAGEYRILARSTDCWSAVATARVDTDKETRLPESLVLGPPASLELMVSPSLTPQREHWTVTLLETGTNPATLLVSELPLDGGQALVPSVPAGRYLLMVNGDGQRWHSQNVEVLDDPTPVHIRLTTIDVSGAVKLGNKPLAGAKVTFGGSFGATSISLETDAGGRFGGVLPRAGRWTVEITASRPRIRRILTAVDVVPTSADDATVDLSLSNATVAGAVVDESGQHVPAAMVALIPATVGVSDRATQLPVEADGTFEFAGLPEGKAILQASGPGETQSDAIEVQVSEGTQDVRLVLRRSSQIRARTLTAEEQVPIAGAFVLAAPTQMRLWPTPARRSDSSGTVDLSLPPGTADLTVAFGAPGRATHIVRTTTRAELVLSIERAGGSLIVEQAGAWDPFDVARDVVAISREGATVLLPTLIRVAGGGGRIDAQRVRSPSLAAGTYRVCTVSLAEFGAGRAPRTDRCASGTLSVGGELVLKIPVRGATDVP